MHKYEVEQEEVEIGLVDLWEKMREGWRTILAALAFGIGAAVLAILLMPPKFESITLLSVGKVAGTEIEPVSTLIERIKSPAFKLAVAGKLGDQKLLEDIGYGTSGATPIAAGAVKGANALIEMKTSAESADDARKLSDGVIATLAERHNEISGRLREKISGDIALVKEKLKTVESELQELSDSASRIVPLKDTQFSQATLITSLRVQKQAEIFGLRQQLSSLELSLLPPATQPTQAIEAPYVPQKPVSPKKGLLLTLGGICGLLLGVTWVLVADARRRGHGLD